MDRVDKCCAQCKEEKLAAILKSAAKAALQAGTIVSELYNKPHQIRYKGDIDLVTEADVAAEKSILDVVTRDHPDIAVLAEESQSTYDKSKVSEPVWIIDPLDGTTNFAHGFPWFAVSIAYVEQGKSMVGVIYAPMLDEFFCACRGYGAWLNGKRITVSSEDSFSKALLATGFPYDVRENPGDVIGALAKILTRCQGVRRAGAAALDLAYVACGRLDGFWEIKLKPWDTAAGLLLVEEAGGRVADFKGGQYSPFVKEIAASNGRIQQKLNAFLSEFSNQLP